MNRHAPGMTMIEAIFATSIFAVVVAISFGISHHSTQSFNESVQNSYLESKGEKAIKRMIEEIGDAHSLAPFDITEDGVTYRGGEIRFKQPISFGIPANPLTPINAPTGLPVFRQVINQPTATFTGDFSLTLDFGWRLDSILINNAEGNFTVPLQGPGLRTDAAITGLPMNGGRTPNGYVSYRFIKNTSSPVGVNGIFDEANEQVDVNNDGDRNDRYVVGFLEKAVFIDGVGILEISRSQMADSNILQPVANAGGDPRSLESNRIFAQQGARLDITLWLFSVGSSRIPRIVRCTTGIFLRNNS